MGHAAFVRLGIQQKQLQKLSTLAAAASNDNMNLVRNVFGEYQKAAVRGGMRISQNLVLYSDPAGMVGGFDFSSDVQRSMHRQQLVGISSHLAAARDSLCQFVSRATPKHAIVPLMEITCVLRRLLGLCWV